MDKNDITEHTKCKSNSGKVVIGLKEEKFLFTMLICLMTLLIFTAFFMFRQEPVESGGILVKDLRREAIVLDQSGYLPESGTECLL